MPLTLVQRKNGIWYIRGTVRKIGTYESTRTRDREIAEVVRAQRENELNQESVFGKKAVVTFEQAADSYVKASGHSKYLIDISKKTMTETGLVIYFEGRKLHSITQDDLDAAAKALYPKAGPATRNRQCYTPFIAVWNHAAAPARGWAEPRKWERPKKAKGTGKRMAPIRAGTRPVNYEYAWRFVSAMSPAPAMVMTALFYTGMRPIELYALHTDQIDIAGRWIVVLFSKTGEQRGVPMHEVLVPMLTAIKKRGGMAFRTRHNEPYPITDDDTKGQLSGAIGGARKRSKIKDVSTYTARHTVSTQLVVEGVHPYIKDQILGHAVTDMSRNYVHVPQAPLIEAINKLPVIEGWKNAPWMADPIRWQRRLVRYENNGRAGAKSNKSVQHLPKWSITT